MKKTQLALIASALVAPGRGLLAADESFPTIAKRFAEYGIPDTEENRRAYRELLFTTPGLAKAISGVILFDETMGQRTTAGELFPAELTRRDMIPGIKVDAGAVDLAGFPGEKITQGLDKLRERLADYRQRGARFTKWRAVITIGRGLPTPPAIAANAQLLALFAGLSQEADLVPIVEPEVLMDGNHTLARCEAVTTQVLETVFAALAAQRVVLEEMLLKTGMVLSGEDCPTQATVAQVAEATVRCLRRTVPAAVPGIVFLSGGQSDEKATVRLNAICQGRDLPWTVSFSYGRALQTPALKAWKGQAARGPAAKAALRQRALANHEAALGQYRPRR